MDVVWNGDDNADLFLETWDRRRANMAPGQLQFIDTPEGSAASMSQALFMKQLENTKDGILKNTLCQYYAAESAESAEDRNKFSYEFLRQAVEAHVERLRMKK